MGILSPMNGDNRHDRRIVRALWVLACAALSWLPAPAAARDGDPHWGRLPNGLEYVLVEDHLRPEIAFSGCLRIGGRTEPAEQKGLTHFLEHLIGRGGTGRLSEEDWQSVRSGIEYTAYTSHDGTCYDFQVSTTRLADTLEAYSEALLEVEITDEKADLEREVVLQERARGLSMPFGPAQHLLWPTAFTEHPYGVLTIGREEVVRNAKAAELRAIHSEWFRPNQLFLAAVGDFDASELADLIRETFGAYPAGEPGFELNLVEPPQGEYREVLIHRREAPGEQNRSRLLVGCKAPAASHPDATALDVVAHLLGRGPDARLVSGLLASGIDSSVSVTPSGARDTGLFVFELDSAQGEEASTLATLWEVLLEMAVDGAGAPQVERRKRALEVERALDRESLMGRARALSAAELAGSYTLALNEAARLRAVSEVDVSRVVARYLSPDRCSLVASVAGSGSGGWRNTASDVAAVWPKPGPISRSETRVERAVSTNGLTTVVEERPGSPTEAMELLIVGAPWRVSEELSGLAPVAAEALVLQPVAGGTTVEELVGSAGGRLEVRSTPDHISVLVEALVEDFPEVAAAFLQALAEPGASDQLVASARRRAEADLVGERASNERLAEATLFAGLFPRHPYGAMPDPESLRRIGALELGEFFDRVFRGQRVFVALVGGLDIDSARALVSDALGELRPGDPWRGRGPSLRDEPVRERISILRDVPQSQIATGVATVGAGHDDFRPLQVTARLLWSRLFNRFVRGEEPIAYWLRARMLPRIGPSPFYVQAGVAPSDEARLLRGIRETIEALASGPITAEEMERARGRLVDGLSPRESQREQARLRAERELLFGGGGAVDDPASRVLEVSTEDVRRVVATYLLSDWPLSVVGRTDDPD